MSTFRSECPALTPRGGPLLVPPRARPLNRGRCRLLLGSWESVCLTCLRVGALRQTPGMRGSFLVSSIGERGLVTTLLWYLVEDSLLPPANLVPSLSPCSDLKLRVRILIDGTLIIFRVKPEDAGKYTCVPSNSLGRSPSASAYLTVQCE